MKTSMRLMVSWTVAICVIVAARADGQQSWNNCTFEGPFFCSQQLNSSSLDETGNPIGGFPYLARKVAVEGDTCLVGAISAGKVFVMNFNTGGVMLSLEDPESQGSTNDFGYSVAMSGDTLIVGDNTHAYPAGSPFADGGNGQAVIYTLGIPSPLGDTALVSASPPLILNDPTDSMFFGTDPIPYGEFGHDVGISTDYAVVGEPKHTNDFAIINEGAAHVFATNNGDLEQSYFNPTPAANDHFGSYVAIEKVASDTFVAISAHEDDTLGNDAGMVYLYDQSSFSAPLGQSTPVAAFPRLIDLADILSLLPSGADLSDIKFGQDTDMEGGRLLVSFTGGAVLYDLTDPSFPIIAKFDHDVDAPVPGLILPPTQTCGLSGDTVVIGIARIYDPAAGEDTSGSIRVYDATSGDQIQQIFDPTLQTDLFLPEEWTNSIAIDGDNLVAGSILADDIYKGEANLFRRPVLGDCNFDGVLDLLDIMPFTDILASLDYVLEADVNLDGVANALDIDLFVDLLNGGG